MRKRTLSKLIKESSKMHKKIFNKKPNINKETKGFLKLMKPLIENVEGKVSLIFGKDDCKIYIEKKERVLNLILDYGFDTVLLFNKTIKKIFCNEIKYDRSLLNNIENLVSKKILYDDP